MSLERIISPDVDQHVLGLSLKTNAHPRTYVPVDLALDVSATLPDGVRLPLELVLSGPTRSHTRTFTRYVPVHLTFTPQEAGEHLVVVRELAHNLFYGLLKFTVSGD